MRSLFFLTSLVMIGFGLTPTHADDLAGWLNLKGASLDEDIFSLVVQYPVVQKDLKLPKEKVDALVNHALRWKETEDQAMILLDSKDPEDRKKVGPMMVRLSEYETGMGRTLKKILGKAGYARAKQLQYQHSSLYDRPKYDEVARSLGLSLKQINTLKEKQTEIYKELERLNNELTRDFSKIKTYVESIEKVSARREEVWKNTLTKKQWAKWKALIGNPVNIPLIPAQALTKNPN